MAIINGTSDNDELFAQQGDEVFGFQGNDTLDAASGEGNNTLEGGGGNDELYANLNDTLRGGIGEDDLFAVGIGGNNSLDGGEDDDRLFIVEGDNNILAGDAGNDLLRIIEGSINLLQGGSDNDFLETLSITGNNTLEGGIGNDTLIGILATDQLFGENGNDSLFAGQQGTQMTGGAGLDRFYLGNGSIPDVPAEVLDFTRGDDKVIIAGILQVDSFDDIILEQDGNDTIVKVLIESVEETFGILRNVQADTLTADDFDFIIPAFSITDASAVEGTDLTFTITRTGDVQANQSITVATSIDVGDTASDNDFTQKTETLAFAVGETEKTFTVSTTEDFRVEENETFTVTLSSTDGVNFSSTNSTAKGTINDDDIPLAAITDSNIFTIKGSGDTVRLKATLISNNSSVVNELGVFIADDAQGTINGIAPGETGYNTAALERARSQGKAVFSAISNFPDLFRTEITANSLSRFLGFDSGDNLQFFLVREGTIDGFQARTISDTNIILADSSSIIITEETEGFSIAWNESTNVTEFNSLVVRIESSNESLVIGTALQGDNQAELIDLTDTTLPSTVQADFSVFREAAFDNEVYFYRVDNAQGLIGTIEATQANRESYLQAAINNLIQDDSTGEFIRFAVDNQGEFVGSAIVASGSILAPMIIVDGTLSQLTDNNTGNDPEVYFPYLGLNSDGVDHIRLLGDNTFGFEDLPDGGDLDYNDVIIKIDFTA